MSESSYDTIRKSADYIRSIVPDVPEIGLILGTGLGGLASGITHATVIPYAVIPHFPVSTVTGHKGELIIGELNGVKVVAMSGRFHYYEGYSMKEVTIPVKVMKMLGIKRLIISNATGSTNENFKTGDLAVICDHINLHHENPLRGENIDELGPRFPDLLYAYDPAMRTIAIQEAAAMGIELKEAVYVGVPGPNLETPAEFKYFKAIGGDVVGMSTVPEVIVARHMDIPVLTFSVVTNEGYGEVRELASLEKIVAIAEEASPKLEQLVTRVIKLLPGIGSSAG